jgi:subtilisin family serine protease
MGTASEPISIQKRALTTQSDATYGLAAVSHREPNHDDYIYDTKAGEGVYAYVVDTGIRVTHDEFEGRAEHVYTAYPGETEDTFGHGTHVAGTIGGKTYGVAKKATLLAVKVFKGRTASTSTILGGYNWAVNDIKDKGRQNNAVINMSLGGPVSSAFNSAVARASSAGILSVIAAGNERQDASNVSPASAPSAITVGAISSDWSFASAYSNYGTVLDIFGPGTAVVSAWYTSDSATNSITGTSMATPHIVGLAATAISVDGVTGVSPITKHLIENSTKDSISGSLYGSPNRLGNNGNSQQ